jgi:ribosomal-protein-alanine N-acetyltransferase
VEKLGLRLEGERPAYLHINGEWRDHVTYVADAPSIGYLRTFADPSAD